MSAAIGQRLRNYLSCCCWSCSPFASIPHLNRLKKLWLTWESDLWPSDLQTVLVPSELVRLDEFKGKKIKHGRRPQTSIGRLACSFLFFFIPCSVADPSSPFSPSFYICQPLSVFSSPMQRRLVICCVKKGLWDIGMASAVADAVAFNFLVEKNCQFLLRVQKMPLLMSFHSFQIEKSSITCNWIAIRGPYDKNKTVITFYENYMIMISS